jgi:hypothetical protein
VRAGHRSEAAHGCPPVCNHQQGGTAQANDWARMVHAAFACINIDVELREKLIPGIVGAVTAIYCYPPLQRPSAVSRLDTGLRDMTIHVLAYRYIASSMVTRKNSPFFSGLR